MKKLVHNMLSWDKGHKVSLWSHDNVITVQRCHCALDEIASEVHSYPALA